MNFDLRLSFLFKFFFNVLDRSGSRISINGKTYKYFKTGNGEEFFVEPLKGRLGLFIMTSQNPGVKQHDYIQIQGQSEIQLYKILEIEYYCGCFADTWIAKLSLVG